LRYRVYRRQLAACLLVLVTACGAGAAAAVPGRLPAAIAPVKGQFLVAARGLADPRFRHSVILLLEHGSEGSKGVIVNRVTPVAARQLLPDMAGLGSREDAMYFGGPVAFGEVLALVRAPAAPPASRPVIDDVWYTDSRQTVEALLAAGTPAARLHLVLGYAGWAPGQLQSEIRRGDWLLSPAAPGQIFRDDPDRLWSELIDRLAPPGLDI